MKKLIIIIIAVAVLSGSAVWFFQSYKSDKSYRSDKSDKTYPSDLPQTYTHPGLGFSFRYPEGFRVNSMAEEPGETILVQKEGGSAKEGFQIFISEFDEPGPITEERIRVDLPEMVIEQPQDIELGIRNQESGIMALIFFSRDESFGRTREVWFVWPEDPQPNGNYLYQITAPAEFDEELSKIMATFRFE